MAEKDTIVEKPTETADTTPKDSVKEPPKPEPTLWPVPLSPTQEAIEGIRYDFCYGARITFPTPTEKDKEKGYYKSYRIILTDLATGVNVWDTVSAPGTMVTDRVKYYSNYRLGIYRRLPEQDLGEQEVMFCASSDLYNKEVMVFAESNLLADAVHSLAACKAFAARHRCKLTVVLVPRFIPLFTDCVKGWAKLITRQETEGLAPYAVYDTVAPLRETKDLNYLCPENIRIIGDASVPAAVLGVMGSEADLHMGTPVETEDKICCISTLADRYAKNWLFPGGWATLIDYLKKAGYKVICVDEYPTNVYGPYSVSIPYGCEYPFKDNSLTERTAMILKSEFVIGVSNGMTALAKHCHKPTLLIESMTKGNDGISNCISNTRMCHGCINDPSTELDSDFMSCPKMTEVMRKYECSRLITPGQIMNKVCQIDTFPKEHNMHDGVESFGGGAI